MMHSTVVIFEVFTCYTVYLCDYYIPALINASYTYTHTLILIHHIYTTLGSGQDHPDDRPAGLPHGAQGQQRAVHGMIVAYI